MAQRNTLIRDTAGDKVFTVIITIIAFFILAICIYPLYFVLMASFSDPKFVNSGTILLYPKGFHLAGYQAIFRDTRIWTGYRNTIFYTLAGTLLSLICVSMAGYALSRRDLPGRRLVMAFPVFTMYFSGGLVPTFLVIKGLNLVNNPLAMVIISCISVYNIIIARSFFTVNIPQEMFEAASVDGCSNQRFFFSIVLPLSKAILAVLALSTAVMYWNTYFWPMILLNDEKYFPLQLVLRQILLVSQSVQNVTGAALDIEAAAKAKTMVEVLKYGVIVVSTLPVIAVYPFLQKYFVKGVMIGSLKG